MAKHYKLVVTSMTCHHLYITTPDDVDKDKVFENSILVEDKDFPYEEEDYE